MDTWPLATTGQAVSATSNFIAKCCVESIIIKLLLVVLKLLLLRPFIKRRIVRGHMCDMSAAGVSTV